MANARRIGRLSYCCESAGLLSRRAIEAPAAHFDPDMANGASTVGRGFLAAEAELDRAALGESRGITKGCEGGRAGRDMHALEQGAALQRRERSVEQRLRDR